MRRILLFSVGALMVAAAAAQTPALRKGVSVQMPVTTNAMAVPDADLADSLVVAVTFRGEVYLNVTRVTSQELSEKVRAELAGHAGKRIYVKGDARTPYSRVAEVLDALRTAEVHAPILLTDQHDSTDGTYAPPKGQEVLLQPAPDGAPSLDLRAGNGNRPDAELKQYAQRDKPVVLRADGERPFGDVVHAVDMCRAAGAKVFLATPGR